MAPTKTGYNPAGCAAGNEAVPLLLDALLGCAGGKVAAAPGVAGGAEGLVAVLDDCTTKWSMPPAWRRW